VIELAGLPGAFSWQGDPPRSTRTDPLRIDAGPRTDLFVAPDGSAPISSAPRLVAPAAGDFLLSGRVDVELRATFDAGALLVWADERNWAKLCLELSPQRDAMVVSVVTRGVSDDCNSLVVEGESVWLRVARLGPAYAFHASTDGTFWRLIRHFALAVDVDPQVGFLAQSPTGDGCAATFEELRFSPERLADLRSGE
jgi:regulation of enolase protein 1 (concanavalin A-like superfamily)